jgi:hypothetical protein
VHVRLMQRCKPLRNRGHASPMMKHAMAVNTPSKAKMASLDQLFALSRVSVVLAGIDRAETWSVREKTRRKTS